MDRDTHATLNLNQALLERPLTLCTLGCIWSNIWSIKKIQITKFIA